MSADQHPAGNGAGAQVAKRRRLQVPPVKCLDRETYLAKMKEVLSPMVQIGAMYSSLVDGIVTDPELMALPIHDHAIVRGHAVFDTCSVVNGRLYRVDIHLDRHIDSALSARIPLPFGESSEACKERMRTIIAQTVVASGFRNASVRYYTSAGPGNFGVTPDGCRPAFYVVVMGKAANVIKDEDMKGIREYTVDLPLKPGMLAKTKSNNYMLNVLTAMASKDRGGNFGILVDDEGCIAESCVLNCTFITKDRRLITPSFDKILAGTSVRKIMDVAHRLVAEGVLTAVSQEKIQVATAKECVEMLLSGGDTHLVPVTHWDDKPVGTGHVGEVTKRLIQLVKEDAEEGVDDHYDLEYA
mmetsp:Transcript_48652/g.125335  ORF Transcript_48652/g.125335 Transcript_48652/m.125335 type:complete len:356 (+) Transcript_48652:67-1134(+)